MTQSYHYQNAIGAATPFDIEVGGEIRLGEHGFAADARLASVATCAITIDDRAGNQAYLSHQRFRSGDDAGRAALTLTGTVAKDSTLTDLVGTGTAFLAELAAGDELSIPGGGGTDYVFVESVTDNTHAVLYLEPANTASGQTADRAARQRLWTGLTEDKTIGRGMDRADGGEIFAAGRSITLDLSEIAKLLHTRKIKKTTTGHDRPEESIGARLTWFLATDIATDLGIVDEGLVTYPSDLVDKGDQAGKYVDDFLVELGVVTGRNMALYHHEATGNLALFHKKPKTFAMPMALRLSNVGADESATTLIVDESPEPTLVQSGQAILSDELVTYSRGSVERDLPSTRDLFGEIDGDAPANTIRKLAKAEAYGDRDLADNASEVDTITCSVTVPAELAGDFRPLACLQVKFSHFDNWQVFTWARIWHMERHQTVATNGQPVPGWYTLSLTLAAVDQPGSGCAFDCTPSVTNYPLGGATDYFNPVPADGDTYGPGFMYMCRSGLVFPVVPTPGYIGRWWFKTFGSSGGGPGTVDYGATNVGNNTLRAVVVGNGTLSITTVAAGGGAGTFTMRVLRQSVAGIPTNEVDYFTQVAFTTEVTGTTVTVTVDDADGDDCITIVDLAGWNGVDFGWSQAVWASDGCGGG